VTQKLHELFSKAYTQSKHPSASLPGGYATKWREESLNMLGEPSFY